MCETVTASSRSPIHIRKVGTEGICKGGTSVKSQTLCGLPVGWDLGVLRQVDLDGLHTCRLCRGRYHNEQS
jgi:hypothetical protein